jgi:hypothetical protein
MQGTSILLVSTTGADPTANRVSFLLAASRTGTHAVLPSLLVLGQHQSAVSRAVWPKKWSEAVAADRLLSRPERKSRVPRSTTGITVAEGTTELEGVGIEMTTGTTSPVR